MALKRKRSDDASPISISSFGSMATPEGPSPTSHPHSFDGAMEMDMSSTRNTTGWDFSSIGRTKANSGDWGLRTRKRVRDNRPDEHIIHENTINKLFTAQRKHPHAEPILSEPTLPPQPLPTIPLAKPQKSTLHAFWNLPAPPVQPIFHQAQQQNQFLEVPRCEDCDTSLQTEADGMDVDMEIDGDFGGSPFSCNECGRKVCGTCAVVSDARHCLQCATSTRNSRRW
ncbi:hypothetical protein DM02DRAFT_612248 [Periconia macrospinosa]|uniref:Uncharacterized protein n=1 Tax=Periconia macrospinosa TaxID=97972 RepID=A0A2V1DY88_9PLEO|nr:hypothetical protein DM02DRAFT_612248 [Periconia macrospinosa]